MGSKSDKIHTFRILIKKIPKCVHWFKEISWDNWWKIFSPAPEGMKNGVIRLVKESGRTNFSAGAANNLLGRQLKNWTMGSRHVTTAKKGTVDPEALYQWFGDTTWAVFVTKYLYKVSNFD